MAAKRMACWNCPRYSRTDRQCADGKANPKRKSDSVTVAEVLGLRALCHYNLYRDALAARMFFPRTLLGISSVAPRRARRGKYGDLTLPEASLAADAASGTMATRTDAKSETTLPSIPVEDTGAAAPIDTH